MEEWTKEFEENRENAQGLQDIIIASKKEVFDEIKERFNSKHQASSCDFGIMGHQMQQMEKKHLKSR